jgi:hypothetical protein
MSCRRVGDELGTELLGALLRRGVEFAGREAFGLVRAFEVLAGVGEKGDALCGLVRRAVAASLVARERPNSRLSSFARAYASLPTNGTVVEWTSSNASSFRILRAAEVTTTQRDGALARNSGTSSAVGANGPTRFIARVAS